MRVGSKDWIKTFFNKLFTISAKIFTYIIKDNAFNEINHGYSVVEITQFLKMEQQTLRFDCLATIVWKRAHDKWYDARWHFFSLE